LPGISCRRSLRTVCSEVLLLCISAFIYSLAFPGFVTKTGIGFLSFFALIPLFVVIRRTTWKLTPLYGFLYGFVFYLFFNYWLKTFHPLAILIVPIIKGGEMLLLFPCLKAADRWFRKWGFLVQAVVWTAYSYLSQNWFAGYPYGTIAYALWQYLPLIQVSSLFGIWGINFLMIIPQSFLGVAFCDHIKIKEWIASQKRFVVVYAALVSFCLVFGFASMTRWNNEKPDRVWKIATVQHNANSWLGGYTTYKRNFNNLRKMSLEAMEKEPEMVIWSETAFVPSVAWHEKYPSDPDTSALVEEFTDFGKSLSVPLLTGNPEGVLDDPSKPAILEDKSWNRKDYNTVIMFENGKIKGTYRKQHLVPFTEYFPYGKIFPRLIGNEQSERTHTMYTDDYNAALVFDKQLHSIIPPEPTMYKKIHLVPFTEYFPYGKIFPRLIGNEQSERTHTMYTDDYNAALVFDKQLHSIIPPEPTMYKKIHLVPFTEHFPYEKQMPHLYALLKANDYHWWETGTEAAVFETDDGLKFSTPICFEDVFGGLCAQFVRNGADLLINMTNDNWSQSVAAEMQHLGMAVFRSVENRRTSVRGTNSGMTCLITPTGKVVDPMEPFKAGWHIYEVPVFQTANHSETLYTKYGDIVAKLFVYLSYILLCIGALDALKVRKKH